MNRVVSINGKSYACRGEVLSVADLIEELSLGGKRIAVERNGEIVPRSRYTEVALVDGDKLEIVGAVGGG